jgi:hypothetical protein
MAIRDDTLRWSQLSLLKRYAKREEIKIAISRHGENLTDCFYTFLVSESIYTFLHECADVILEVLTSLRASNLVDRALATPEEACVRSARLSMVDLSNAKTCDF